MSSGIELSMRHAHSTGGFSDLPKAQFPRLASRVANCMKTYLLLRAKNTIAPVLPIPLVMLVGCAVPMQLNFHGAISTEFLDGNYQRLASCTYERLGGPQAQLTKTDLPHRGLTIVASTAGSDKRWELSFINEDGGRQTRLEVRSSNGSYPSEHTLALARACAA